MTAKLGLNYVSLWHFYSEEYTTDEVLHRDFTRFHNDGIEYISLSLIWYRLEGDTRGDYNDAFLDEIKRVSSIAHQHNIKVMITFHTLWNEEWNTPAYVIDPYEGLRRHLAIVRSQEMREAFLDMVTHTVDYLKGTPGIDSWCVLNEPWYWPKSLPPPLENVDQRENFITLFQDLSAIVKALDDRPVTIKFVSIHHAETTMFNIFERDWSWDGRLFEALDFISLNTYASLGMTDEWKAITTNNILGCSQRGKKVWFGECGFENDDTQVEDYRAYLHFVSTLPVEVIIAWYWRGDTATKPGAPVGTGYNLCQDETGAPRPAYYVFVERRLSPRVITIELAATVLIQALTFQAMYSILTRIPGGEFKTKRKD